MILDLNKAGMYWFAIYNGEFTLQHAPFRDDDIIDPRESCDVSVSAFTEEELEEVVSHIAFCTRMQPDWVRKTIRG